MKRLLVCLSVAFGLLMVQTPQGIAAEQPAPKEKAGKRLEKRGEMREQRGEMMERRGEQMQKQGDMMEKKGERMQRQGDREGMRKR